MEPACEVVLSPLCYPSWAERPFKEGSLRSMCLVGFGVRQIRIDISDLPLSHSWVVFNKHLSSEP